jgi:hypothetical protein
MKSQITRLIVRAVLSAGISLSQQPQAAAASVSDEVRQMCSSEVIKLCAAHMPKVEAASRCATDNADKLSRAYAARIAAAPPR